jgi:bifunctional DNase/RNase
MLDEIAASVNANRPGASPRHGLLGRQRRALARPPGYNFMGSMADAWLRAALLASATLLIAACEDRHGTERERFAPAPKGSAAPPPRERRESAEPPTLDPAMKPPPGYRRMAVGGVAPVKSGSAIVLMDDSAKRGLVLLLGDQEALSIVAPVDHRRDDRPLTHDLLGVAVKKLGADVISVRVDRVEDEVFYASVLLAKGGHVFQLDARPSEALSQAIGNGVPIFVAETVLAQAGIDLEKFDFRRLREEKESARPSGRREEVML